MKSFLILAFSLALATTFSCGGGDGWTLVSGTGDGANPGLGQVRGGIFNGNMEADNTILTDLPNGWENKLAFFNAPNNYTMTRTDTFAFEGRYSLMIKATTTDSNQEYPYFQQLISSPNIRAGASVRLTAAVKTENLQRGGFNLYLLTPDITGLNFIVLASSEFSTAGLRGNNDWARYEAPLSSFPIGVGQLYIFLQMQPNATGAVYFDDVRLEVAN